MAPGGPSWTGQHLHRVAEFPAKGQRQREFQTGQRQREFQVLEGLRPRGIPEEAIPFPEVLGYWGFRVENGEELRAVLKLVTWRRP